MPHQLYSLRLTIRLGYGLHLGEKVAGRGTGVTFVPIEELASPAGGPALFARINAGREAGARAPRQCSRAVSAGTGFSSSRGSGEFGRQRPGIWQHAEF